MRESFAKLLVVGCLCIAACSSRPEKRPATINDHITNEMSDFPELQRMDHAVDSFLQFWLLEGASLSIMRNDSLVYAKGYGWADKEAGEKMGPGTKLRLASVSKLLTAAGIMRMAEDSLLTLQSPVFGPAGILSEYSFKDDNYCLITVEHLLRHQGGFSVRGGDPMFSTRAMMSSWGLSEPPTETEITENLLKRRVSYTPGSGQIYSNFGYLLLSQCMEKVSGKSYEDYMRDEVFAKAGCTDFHLAGNFEKDRLPGECKYYVQPNDEPVPVFNGGADSVVRCYGGNDIHALSGAGAWVGSTVELARFVASIDGLPGVEDILSEDSIYQMTYRIDDATYPLGWVDCKEDGEWTRTGSFSGTSALVKVYPDGECWILVTNTSAWRGSRFTKNTAALMKKLRARFSGRLPKQDLFELFY